MECYARQYEAATAGIPKTYQMIVNTEYKDKPDVANEKIQGEIALFRSAQAQTPRKIAQKDAPKMNNTISFINDIPGMFAEVVA